MSLVIPFTFAGAGANTPTSRLDADYNVIRDWINLRNPTVGAIGARPSPGNAGAIYVASDQANTTYVDDGAAWQSVGVSPGANYQEFVGIATPSNPASGALRLFSNSGATGLRRLSFLDAAGQVQDLESVLVRAAGAPIKDIVSTSTETSMFSSAPTIKGNTGGNNRAVRLTGFGDYLNNNGTPTTTVRVKYGGTTFFTAVSGALGASATRNFWTLEFYLLMAGATNAQFGRGFTYLPVNQHGVAGTAVTFETGSAWYGGINTPTVDDTADQTLDVTQQWSASDPTHSFRPWFLLAEVL